jgi:hypothetical protein
MKSRKKNVPRKRVAVASKVQKKRVASKVTGPNPFVSPVLDLATHAQLIAEAVARAEQLGKIKVPPLAPKYTFSLAQYQTPFEVQGDRGTCWALGATAALEAAYKRKYGITLDLSQEYIFHVGKAFEIHRDPPGDYLSSTSPVENNSSLTGFQGSSDIAEKLTIFAVPEERFAPYLASSQELENIVMQLGYSGGAASLTSQEDFDAFEYCEQHIPLIARVNAMYRATDWGSLGSSPSTTDIENTLLAGHEVIADVKHKVPPIGGHVLLLIGFDRDRQVFQAKNSWGENQFIEIQYQNDPNWGINAGTYIKDVTDPNNFVQSLACWVGNWWMNFKGKTGRLLIRRFVDFRHVGEPTKLGNYYVDGQKFEVNGSFQDWGSTMDMFIATSQGKLKPGTLQGTEVHAKLSFKDIFNASGVAGDGSPASLSRYATRYAAIWQQGPNTPWQARHGLTGEQYQTTFDQLVSQGYRLVQVCGYSEWLDARYAAIWSQADGPAWEARHGLSAIDYQNTFDTLVGQGYRLKNVSGYAINGEARYAGIWEKSEGPEWQARHGMTGEQYQKTFDQLNGQGFRLVQVCGYRVNVDVLFAAIWEKRAGPAWEARHGLTSTEYQKKFDEFVSKGYRLVWVSGYSQSGIARYAAIWEQSSEGKWQARHGLNSIKYQQTFDELAKKGYGLAQVCGYGDGF